MTLVLICGIIDTKNYLIQPILQNIFKTKIYSLTSTLWSHDLKIDNLLSRCNLYTNFCNYPKRGNKILLWQQLFFKKTSSLTLNFDHTTWKSIGLICKILIQKKICFSFDEYIIGKNIYLADTTSVNYDH